MKLCNWLGPNVYICKKKQIIVGKFLDLYHVLVLCIMQVASFIHLVSTEILFSIILRTAASPQLLKFKLITHHGKLSLFFSLFLIFLEPVDSPQSIVPKYTNYHVISIAVSVANRFYGVDLLVQHSNRSDFWVLLGLLST